MGATKGLLTSLITGRGHPQGTRLDRRQDLQPKYSQQTSKMLGLPEIPRPNLGRSGLGISGDMRLSYIHGTGVMEIEYHHFWRHAYGTYRSAFGREISNHFRCSTECAYQFLHTGRSSARLRTRTTNRPTAPVMALIMRSSRAHEQTHMN